MDFSMMKLTGAGLELLARNLSGETGIEFRSIRAGSGGVIDLDSATELGEFRKEGSITKMERDGAMLTLTTVFDNADVTEGFTWTEIGVMAADDEGEEILFAYASTGAGKGSYIPANDGTTTVENVLEIKVYVGGASNVTVTVKSMTYATNEQLETHTGDKENPHKVTKKQVGLGDVPNVTTNNQTPTYQAGTTLEKLKSGEKLSNAMGKIACAVEKLIEHLGEIVPIDKGGTGATNGRDAINGMLRDGTVNLSKYQFGGNINVPEENGTIYFELISDTATGWVMAKPFIYVEEK